MFLFFKMDKVELSGFRGKRKQMPSCDLEQTQSRSKYGLPKTRRATHLARHLSTEDLCDKPIHS
jgi:hypothetical protein